jgi:hypothetical protein
MEVEARYEFRVFGKDLSKCKEMLDRYPKKGEVRQSEEHYLFSDRVENYNAKIRDNKLDIKVLKSKLEELEQWFPAFKCDFPAEIHELNHWIGELYNLKEGTFHGKTISMETFLKVIQDQAPVINLAKVVKSRQGFDVDGCMAEFAEVMINGTKTETIALESTDPQKIRKSKDKLGLEGAGNMNYIKAIKKWAKR